LKSFTSSGEFYIDGEGVDASQQWSLAGVNMANIPLSGNESLSAVLTSALMKTAGSMQITDNKLTGSGTVDLQQLVMQATGESDTTKVIAKALQSLSSLNMDMFLEGTLSNPDFKIKSDLDNQLANMALSELTASQQDKLDELNQKLNAMIGNEQSLISGELGDVNSMISAAQGDSAAIEELLKSKLNNVVEQQKNKLFDKLKGKFGQDE
jgi:uncharacterized protein (TIGR03545 family)